MNNIVFSTLEDWMTNKRGGKKIADVIVSLASGQITTGYGYLEPYVFASGFDSVEEWKTEINRINKSQDLLQGEIYCVVKK